MQNTSDRPASVDLGELEQHLRVLRDKRAALQKQLDKGVKRSEFARLHAFATLVGKAEDALGQVKAQARG